MASVPDIELDVPRAWRLADSLVDAAFEPDRERFRSYGGIQVAKVLARAGQADSARAVLLGISGGETPNWLAYDEAHLKLILGQSEEALRLLEQFVASDPSQTDFLANDWWFRPLWNDSTFRALTRADRAPTDGGPSQVSGPRR